MKHYRQRFRRFQRKIRRKIYRIIHTLVFLLNQKVILFHTRKNKDILLIPVPENSWLSSGSVEHYYHFLFDLIFPVYSLLLKIDPSVTLYLKEIGLLTEKLHQLLPNNVKVINCKSDNQQAKEVTLVGMDPYITKIRPLSLSKILSKINSHLVLPIKDSPGKILLIERLPPNDFYQEKAIFKGAGSSRRSIINHQELESFLKENIKEPYSIINLQLENLSITEQIAYFQDAYMVIAQHGASLANAIWMKPETIMLELRYVNRKHFLHISNIRRLEYFRYKLDSIHATIDLDDFKCWIKKHGSLREVFNC